MTGTQAACQVLPGTRFFSVHTAPDPSDVHVWMWTVWPSSYDRFTSR